MVILQFNKLIRNKWVWGVFAILVSLAFVAPDEWLRDSDDPRNMNADSRNRLKGVEYDGALYEKCDHLVRYFLPKFQRSNLSMLLPSDSGRSVWKAYAAAKTLSEAGYAIPDSLLAERIKAMFTDGDGAFSEAAYGAAVRRTFDVEPHVFESQLRLMMLLETGIDGIVSSSTWLPQMALDQANRDFTDKFTVRVAVFNEDKQASNAIKLDDAGLKKWYEANSSTVALPDRYKLRSVKYDATASNLLARAVVTEEAIKERYDANAAKGIYDVKPATTNDVKKVKPLDEVRQSIETALKQEEALEILKADVRAKTAIDEEDEDAVKGLLANLAKADGLKVETSDWFTLSGGFVPGFMKNVSLLFPGVPRKDFDRTVRSLIDYGYGIVSSSRAVWVVELADKSEAHTPTFEEAKGKIADAALRDARKDAFKAQVEAVAAKGVDAVLASGNVTTNITFSPCSFARDYASSWENRYGSWDFKDAGFENAEKVVFAARSLEKGQVSPFVQLSTGKAALVVCENREAGDPADVFKGERFARMVSIMQLAPSESAGKWLDANLESLGYTESPSPAEDTGYDE